MDPLVLFRARLYLENYLQIEKCLYNTKYVFVTKPIYFRLGVTERFSDSKAELGQQPLLLFFKNMTHVPLLSTLYDILLIRHFTNTFDLTSLFIQRPGNFV